MINVETIVLGELQTNCYLVWDDDTKMAWIIDPADDGDYISERILELNLKPEKIILTHGHFDHVLGLLSVKLNFDVPILLHPKDKFLLKKAQSHAKYWLNREVDPVPKATAEITDNMELSLGSSDQGKFKILHTPGHTPGSICLYNEEIIFTGDTLFDNGIGRTDFSYSDPQEMRDSLQKILDIPIKLTAYPGHGKTTTNKQNLV